MNGAGLDVNEGLIGQLFGQNLQSFPESSCHTEYMDILGGDMNDGRLPGQRTRCSHIDQDNNLESDGGKEDGTLSTATNYQNQILSVGFELFWCHYTLLSE